MGNVVVDTTQAVQYLIEIKEHVNSAFQWTAKEGPLCEENMRGIRFNIMDVTLHTDSIHRGGGQIMPPTRRCCFAAELTAKPTLQEPVFLVEITCPQEAMSGVYNCMNLRRGCVFEKFDWDENSARKIWCWGPETEGANVVVDSTQAVQYLIEIKEHVTSAFQWATKEGPLCEENMRGIRFNIMDVTLHTDAIHRGAGQIMPPTRRCCFAAELTAKPTLQEPVFLVEITCPQEAMSGVYNCMNLRRGCVFEKFDWDENSARKIWCWGPETEGANVVVDSTQAVQYLIEIKEHVNSAFQWTAKEGPLCEENMRGIRFNI